LEVELNDVALRRVWKEATEPLPVPADRLERVTAERVGEFPGWLRAVDALHRAARSLLVIAVDLLIILATGFIAHLSARQVGVLGAAFLVALYMFGIYADRSPLEAQGVLWFLGKISMPLSMATLVAVGASKPLGWPVMHTLRFALATLLALGAVRGLSWGVVVASRRRGLGLRRTLIVGDPVASALVTRKLIDYPEPGLAPVAFLGLDTCKPSEPGGPPSSAQELAGVVRSEEIEEVVLVPEGADDELLHCVKASDGLDANFSILPVLSDVFLHPGLSTQVGGLPLISLGRLAQTRTTLSGKRFFDVAIAGALLVLFTPVLALAALAVKLHDRGPVLYRQRRVGRGGDTFEMLKFRSMVVGAERLVVELKHRNVNDGLLFKLHDDPRITPAGRLLRRLSIDELPQLWNVIRGQMSLVGPRPLPVEPDEFGTIENKRHAVPPGITGYWQIAGGHDLNYEEMIKLDLSYIQNWSLLLDVRLLLRTPAALLHRRGPY
jgi:exopolysaccharide biosynthesis polyprenyl glycosylphosphotransferase